MCECIPATDNKFGVIYHNDCEKRKYMATDSSPNAEITYWRELSEEESKVIRQLEAKLQILGTVRENKSLVVRKEKRAAKFIMTIEKESDPEIDEPPGKKRKTIQKKSCKENTNHKEKKKPKKTAPTAQSQANRNVTQESHRRRNKDNEEFYSLVWF
jgi:hypothetical protein